MTLRELVDEYVGSRPVDDGAEWYGSYRELAGWAMNCDPEVVFNIPFLTWVEQKYGTTDFAIGLYKDSESEVIE